MTTKDLITACRRRGDKKPKTSRIWGKSAGHSTVTSVWRVFVSAGIQWGIFLTCWVVISFAITVLLNESRTLWTYINEHVDSFEVCRTVHRNTGLFEMIVKVLTTCHTQYTWDGSICIFLFNRTTFQVFVTYLTGALYVHPLWFYKHQHDNRVRSKLFLECQRWWFQ